MELGYGRRCLLSFKSVAPPTLGIDVLLRIRQLGLQRHRGHRSGKSAQALAAHMSPGLCRAGNGAYVMNGSRVASPSRCRRVYGGGRNRKRSLVNVPLVRQRHAKPVSCMQVFASMNVRSLSPLKLDSLLVQLNDHPVDILPLCETWHDPDSVAIRRLRSDGYSVVERARLRTRLSMSPPRATSGSSSCVTVVVYHPGSAADAFFTEFADLLDHLATLVDPVTLAGDINIRLERVFNPNVVEFSELLADHGLTQRVDGATHDAGGTLDVVFTRDDLPPPAIDIIDVGLSDHHLLHWTSSLRRSPPVYVTSSRRPWRSFDQDVFQADLLVSALCDVGHWSVLDGDELVKLYDDTVTLLLDRQVPSKNVTRRRRPSNLWYDEECR